MTLHLELPADVEARLTTEAQHHNLTLKAYALNKLVALPEYEPAHEETAGEAALRIAKETFWSLPAEELAKLPLDFSINHNHYIHGAPKVEE